MNKKIINWFFADDADNHDMKQVVYLLAGAVVLAAGCFAGGILFGIL